MDERIKIACGKHHRRGRGGPAAQGICEKAKRRVHEIAKLFR
jgi:hypothetical protein